MKVVRTSRQDVSGARPRADDRGIGRKASDGGRQGAQSAGDRQRADQPPRIVVRAGTRRRFHHSSSSRKIHSTVASWPTTRLRGPQAHRISAISLCSISISAPSRLCRAFCSRVSSVRPRAFLMPSMRASVIRRHHCEPRGPAIRPDNQGNRATARSLLRGSPSHTSLSYGRTRCAAAYCPQIAWTATARS